jgi:hypothetical protein
MNADVVSMGECIAQGLFPSAIAVSKMGDVSGVVDTEVDIWSVGGTFEFPAGTDIKISVISASGAAAICSVQYRGALLS